jgi:hypothetical protein
MHWRSTERNRMAIEYRPPALRSLVGTSSTEVILARIGLHAGAFLANLNAT